MKKSLLLLAMLLITTGAADAKKTKTPKLPKTQPEVQAQVPAQTQTQAPVNQLLPINTVLSTSPSSDPGIYDNTEAEDINASVPTNVMDAANAPAVSPTGTYEATYVPRYGENMVPQNAAAKGEPIPQKPQKIINIRTKQRSQGNDYWNPGGKGNRTYYD